MIIIGRFCEKLIEAGWLVAAVLVVVFLNPFSDQVFEPDKVALFRVLVVLMVAAWSIRALDSAAFTSGEHAPGQSMAKALQALRDMPIAGLALLLLLIYLASTVTSISPRASWWGSYQRAQGAYTFLAYVGLFFSVLSVLRQADQLDRLITLLLVTSFPVAAYAVLQHYGMSLLQFSGTDVEVRVISTLGNAIFLAAYLVMVIPLTLWRTLQSGEMWSVKPVQSALGFLIYGGLFLLQLVAVVFTQSRGPILGLLVELFVLFLLVALLRGRRRWALGGVLLAAAAVALLVALNMPGLPTDSLRGLPYVRRFSHLVGSEARTVQSRVLAWEVTLDAIRAAPERAILGYGPETMKSVFTRFMLAQLWVLQGGGQYGTFDRAHNAVFDALFTRGAVGLVAYLFLYALIFYQALRWLGLARTQREVGALRGLLTGGAGLGLIVPWLWRGDLVLMGIGMPAGMVAGLVVYLIGKVALAPGLGSTPGGVRPVLVAALVAAIVGHFIETQTGIGIVATRLYFWLYTALMILLGAGRIGEAAPVLVSQPKGRSRRGRRGRPRDVDATLPVSAPQLGPLIAMGLVAAVLLGALSYAFVHGFNVPGARGPAQTLILGTWILAGVLILFEHSRLSIGVSELGRDALVYGVTSLLWLVPFALYHRVNAQVLDRLSASYLVFLIWLLLAMVGIAAALHWNAASSRSARRSNRPVLLYLVVVLLAVAFVWKTDVARIRADIHEKVGKTAMRAGRWDQAIPNLQRAVALQPWQDQYYIYLGGAYVEQAQRASDPSTKETWMEQARQVFEQGQALAPRDSDHPRQLGLMYRVWADWTQDPSTRRHRLRGSLKHYRMAVELNPQNPDLRLDLAGTYFALGMNDEALGQYRHAVDIGSPNHLGRAYAGLGDVHLVQGQLEQAAQAYRNALQAGRDWQEVLQMHMRAAENNPDDIQVRESLALVYAAADRQDDALNELEAALGQASNDTERAEVEKLMKMIGQ